MGKYRHLHKIFYQFSKVKKPFAIEVSANISIEKGTLQDLEVAIYSELLTGSVRIYDSDKEFTFLAASRYAWGRLLRVLQEVDSAMPILPVDWDMFEQQFEMEYDKIYFGDAEMK